MWGALVLGCCLVLWQYLFAMLEIAVEGPNGWAITAPTFRKMTPVGPIQLIYRLIMPDKEITGYHLAMFILPFLFVHLPFAFAWAWGQPNWSWEHEADVLACFSVICVSWDFTWFVLNPDFTIERFRPGEIWWHSKWLMGLPIEYWIGFAMSAGLIALSVWLGGWSAAGRLAIVFGILGVGTILFVLLAPVLIRRYSRECAQHRLTAEWAKWLTPDELNEMNEAMFLISGARATIANLGRIRAQRQQLGVKK